MSEAAGPQCEGPSVPVRCLLLCLSAPAAFILSVPWHTSGGAGSREGLLGARRCARLHEGCRAGKRSPQAETQRPDHPLVCGHIASRVWNLAPNAQRAFIVHQQYAVQGEGHRIQSPCMAAVSGNCQVPGICLGLSIPSSVLFHRPLHWGGTAGRKAATPQGFQLPAGPALAGEHITKLHGALFALTCPVCLTGLE